MPTIVGTEAIPDNISWPQEADYSQGLIQGVGAVADQVGTSFDLGGIVNPPIIQQISMLKTALEDTTGISWGQLVNLAGNVYSLANAANTAQIATAIGNLVSGAIDVATSVMEAVEVGAAAAEALSALGSVVGIMTDMIAGQEYARVEYAKGTRDCQQYVDAQMSQFCQAMASAARSEPTGVDENGAVIVTPSDMFRPVLYAWQAPDIPFTADTPIDINQARIFRKKHLPVCVASMYVALCGGETQGLGPIDRDWWNGAVSRYRKDSGNQNIGIPQDLQRRMWALIKGIMTATRNPGITANVLPPGDAGRALLPILQDIVLNLYLSGTGQAGNRGYGIDDGFLNILSQKVLVGYYHYERCPQYLPSGEAVNWAGTYPAGGSRCDVFVNLAGPFLSGISTFQKSLHSQFKRNGVWQVTPSKPILKPVARGTLLLSPLTSIRLVRAIDNVETISLVEAEKQKQKDYKKAAMVSAGVIMAGGAFVLIRRYMKKRRLRA